MESRIILGVPYVFARHKLRKQKHVEVVRLVQRPVLCHNACGLFYVPNEPLEALVSNLGARCPCCEAPPKSWRIGEPEEIEVSVHMAFGNLVDVSFLRAIGPLARVRVEPSTAVVRSKR